MTRGLLLIATVLPGLQSLWMLLCALISTNLKLSFTVDWIGVAAAAEVIGIVSGLGSRMLKGVGDLGSSDRLSLDERNLIWRQNQADIALSMMHSEKDWLVGMGPTANVPMASQYTNELHFGYHSI